MRSLSMFLVAAMAIMACIMALPVAATTLTVSSGTIGTVGEAIDVVITADSFPNGMSGYNLTASLTDPSNAEIIGVTFPSWASFHDNGTIPTDTLMFKASDFMDQVKGGATAVTLATLRIRGDAVGTTNVALSVKSLHSDPPVTAITPTIVPGTITVGTPPVTSPTTTVPTTTVTTTVPTTTVTTTVPTTTVTTTVPTTTVTTTVPTTTVTTTIPTTTVTTTVPTTTVTTQPTGDPGYITVFTFPMHAEASVDGQSVGSTPLMDYQIPSGIHTISISVAGYSGYSTSFTLLPNEHLRFPLVILQRGVPGPTQTTPAPTVTTTQTSIPGQTGALSVKSFPRGASIFLNGEYKAITPAVIQGLAPGDYELKLIKTGYQTKVRTVTINAGQTTSAPIIILVRTIPAR